MYWIKLYNKMVLVCILKERKCKMMTNSGRFVNDFLNCKRLYKNETETNVAIAALYTTMNPFDKKPFIKTTENSSASFRPDFFKEIVNQALLEQLLKVERYSDKQLNNAIQLINHLNYLPICPSNLYISYLWAANLTPSHFYQQLILRTKRMHYWLYDTRLNYQTIESYSMLYATMYKSVAKVDLKRKYCQQLLESWSIDVNIVRQLSLFLPLLSNQLVADIQKLQDLVDYLERFELFYCQSVEQWLILSFLACCDLSVEQQIDRLLLTTSQLKHADRFRKQALNDPIYFLFGAILSADYTKEKQELKNRRRVQTAELIVLEALTQYCDKYLGELAVDFKEENKRKMRDELFIRS